MKSVLVHSELWSYVSKGIVRPAESEADSLAAWILKDEKALATILLSVKTSQLMHVKQCTTSESAWKKLEEVHRPTGPSRKVTVFKQLVNLKMADQSTMNDHLNSFFGLSDQLSEIDIKLPDELLSIILLSSLPPSYENFVVAIESHDQLPKPNVLKNKLMEEHNRRGGDSAHQSGEVAFFSKYKKPQQQHQQSARQNSSSFQVRKCYRCQRKGHIASECKSQNRSASKQDSSFAMLNAAGSAMLNKNVWVLDSGSTSHLCCEKQMFDTFTSHREKIELAGDNYIYSEGIGQVTVSTNTANIKLREVLFVPALITNFLSLSKAAINGHKIEMDNTSAAIVNQSNAIVLRADLCGSLYIYKCEQSKMYAMKSSIEYMIWHERFGHLNINSLKKLSQNNLVRGIELKNYPETINCEVCLKGKMCSTPFSKNSSIKTSAVLELVHSDICGPMRTTSLGGFKYFALFIDDFSRMIFVHFLKKKSDILSEFKIFKSRVERETGNKIKKLRTDNGCEFVSGDFNKFLESEGVHRQLTVQYTPQQNGVAERANRTLVEMARCLLLSSKLPESLWGEAINTAVYIRNRSPTNLILSTPYEAWTNVKPAVNHLRVFGSKAIALDKRPGKSKFAPRGIECVMVGYSSESKAYRLYNPATRTVIKSRDVKFIESSVKSVDHANDYTIVEPTSADQPVVYKQPKIKDDRDTDDYDSVIFEDAEDDLVIDIDEVDGDVGGGDGAVGDAASVADGGSAADADDIVSSGVDGVAENFVKNPRQRKREKSEIAGDAVRPWTLRSSQKPNTNFNMRECVSNPISADEALARRDGDRWRESMLKEYNALLANGTWILVDLPKGRRAIKSKWVFTIKRDKNGQIERYKSRLVAKGCSQQYGVDYSETFSPVVRYSSLRLILACAVEYNLIVHQMDVTTAYLNGTLSEDVYMVQPEMFECNINPNKVCKLKKSLYGLKQAGREWNLKLDKVLKDIGFKPCNADSCVYTMKSENKINIIAVYVDDILLAFSSEKMLDSVKNNISKQFEVIDKGPIDYFLGMQITCANNTISISHKQFIRELLKDNGMEDTRKCFTPLDPGQKFQRCSDCSSCSLVDKTEYQSLIGSLMYLGISSRPDIAHSVSKLAQFNSNPHAEHVSAAKHLLRYLNSTINSKLLFRKTGENLKAFADADWAGSCDQRKSYTGYTFVLAGASVTWESRKQQTVALSTTEAEYMALSAASREAVYLRNFLCELGFHKFVQDPTVLNGDNISSQQLVKNPVFHARSKHIDIRYHYIREVYAKNVINLKYVSTEDNVADIFTKNVNKIRNAYLSRLLGLE